MYFTPKTTFNFMPRGNNTDGGIASPKDFTKIIYKRSVHRASKGYTFVDDCTCSDEASDADTFFIDQIDSSGDANAFTLLMMPFERWHTVMKELGYVIHSA